MRASRTKAESRLRYDKITAVTDRKFEQMKTDVVNVDKSGAISLYNTDFEDIVSRPDLVGKNWNDVLSETGLSLDRINASAGRSTETEITVNVAGRKKVLLIAASRLADEEHTKGDTIIVSYDITKLKEFEAESARRERLSEMGHLAAGVAHEIRNPLNAISIAAQRLAGEFKPTDNEQEYFTIASNMRSESKRLNSIITRFLALAKTEQKQTEKINLKEFLIKETKVLALEASQLSIDLDIQVAGGLILNADKDSLMQLITNLYNNSKEALDGKQGKIHIAAAKTESGLSISFDDSGPGIAEDISDEIFRPFFTTKESGTGLGLPTVDKIVRELGGQIKLEKSKLGGARFVMTFDES